MILPELLGAFGCLVSRASFAVSAETPPPLKFSADQIVDRNVVTRGGLGAWRISLAGKMGAGGNQRATLSVAVPASSSAKP